MIVHRYTAFCPNLYPGMDQISYPVGGADDWRQLAHEKLGGYNDFLTILTCCVIFFIVFTLFYSKENDIKIIMFIVDLPTVTYPG